MSIVFRDARRTDVPAIVALLADDFLGAARETAKAAGATPGPGGAADVGGAAGAGGLDEAYWAAFDAIAADPRNRLIVADRDGEVLGTLQLTLLPGLSRHGMLRGQIEAVRVSASARGQGLGRTMIAWAIEEARRAGCGLVQLTSDKRRGDAL